MHSLDAYRPDIIILAENIVGRDVLIRQRFALYRGIVKANKALLGGKLGLRCDRVVTTHDSRCGGLELIVGIYWLCMPSISGR